MNKSLMTAELIVTTLCAVFTLLILSFIFVKINRRLSISFYMILSLYGIASIMRIYKLNFSDGITEQIRSLINIVALCLLLFSLQYFIFVVSEYKARIESESPIDLKRRLRKVRITKYVSLSI